MDVLMHELFKTPIGLLSLFTIGFIVFMGFWLARFVRKNIERETAAQKDKK